MPVLIYRGQFPIHRKGSGRDQCNLEPIRNGETRPVTALRGHMHGGSGGIILEMRLFGQILPSVIHFLRPLPIAVLWRPIVFTHSGQRQQAPH